MAVFSCMRLEDVSDSRCRFLGKLIFQAKLFLFWWNTAVVCECVCVCVCVLFKQSSSSDPADRLQVKRRQAAAAASLRARLVIPRKPLMLIDCSASERSRNE